MGSPRLPRLRRYGGTAGRYDKGMAKKRKTSAKAAKRGARTRTASPRAISKTASRKTVARSGRKTAGARKTSRRSTGPRFVYFFGGGRADGDRSMKDLLGGKGAGLAEMTNAGLPVPPGFTITTEACNRYYGNNRTVPAAVDTEMLDRLRRLEATADAALGSVERPLLLSVRSGAKFSMPGMMDTILNLGLNDDTVQALHRQTGNGQFAFDSYRRFIQMFGNVVLEISKEAFEEQLDNVKKEYGVTLDTELGEGALREVVARYKDVIRVKSGRGFPEGPLEQLRLARDAVFRSWNNPRAKEYRRIYNIPDNIGTAVNVQLMVFGNTGDRSATGVGFTRNPATGAKEFYGEFLVNAQGEDVVAGIRTPQPIRELERLMPAAYGQLRRRSPIGWSVTTRTCRTSNSPSRTSNCSCCRPGAASGPRAPPFGSPPTWSTSGSSPLGRRSSSSTPTLCHSCWHPTSIPTPGAGSRSPPRGCRPRRVRRLGRWCSRPRTP